MACEKKRKEKSAPFGVNLTLETSWSVKRKEQDYTFRRQFIEKPRIVLGCPDHGLCV